MFFQKTLAWQSVWGPLRYFFLKPANILTLAARRGSFMFLPGSRGEAQGLQLGLVCKVWSELGTLLIWCLPILLDC